MKEKLRIFVADDHAIMREGLKALVNAQPDMEVVGEADNGRSAWRLTKELEPDIVVMDVSMPVLNGIRATTLIKRVCKNVKVLVLTVHEDQGYLRQLLEAGASGYVLKNAAADELINGLRIVASGRVYLDPTQAEKVVGGFVSKRGQKRDGPSTNLSTRETEVLRLVAWGYANKEIAGRLNISVKTVETHKSNVMEKLGLRSRSDFVRYALRQGWLEEI
jgi:DNA-binding NarL/FixJ family response regulator